MEKILQNLWKISLVLELLCCFRIAGEISFFRPLSLGALFHRENTVMNPQNTKCHRSPNIIFFRHFLYFSVTKAIYTYVLAKFEKMLIFSFSKPFLDFHRRPLFKFYPMLWYCLQRVNSSSLRTHFRFSVFWSKRFWNICWCSLNAVFKSN